jgi:hypothetical protein
VRGFWRSLLLSSLLLSSSTVLAQSDSDELARLQERLELAHELLKRFEDGSPPCYNESCQRTKNRNLIRAQRKIDLLPLIESDSNNLRRIGLLSGQRLIEKSFNRRPPQTKTAADWLYWWKRRYDHDLRLNSYWVSFKENFGRLRSNLRYFSGLAQGTRRRQHFVQYYWDKGLGEAAFVTIEAVRLNAEAKALLESGREKEGKKLQKQASDKLSQLREIEESMGENLKPVLRKLFPELSEQQLVGFAARLYKVCEIYGDDQLFSPDLISYTESIEDMAHEAFSDLQELHDLEYGILGLNNFESSLNPAVAAQQELQIQKTLDIVDISARGVVDIATFVIYINLSSSIFGAGAWLNYGTAGAATYFSEKYEYDFSTNLWGPSNRSQELQMRAISYEALMAKRKQELEAATQQVKQKIQELEFQIRLIQEERTTP